MVLITRCLGSIPVLNAAPKELKLWFNEAVEPALAKIWIVSAEAPNVPLTGTNNQEETSVTFAMDS